jgi:hypothetical protein
MRHAIVLAATVASLGTTACNSGKQATQAHRDAQAVAMVEQAQHRLPPPLPLVPQAVAGPMPAGITCRFTDLAHAAGRPILLSGPERAVMQFEGQAEVFAADPGSATLPGPSHSHYAGKRHALKLEPQPTPAHPIATGFVADLHQPVALTVTDEHERKVLESVGDLTCS